MSKEKAIQYCSEIIKHISEGVVCYRNDTIPIYLNSAAERMLGAKADAVVGRPVTPEHIQDKGLGTLASVTLPLASPDARTIETGKSKPDEKVHEIETTHPEHRILQVTTYEIEGNITLRILADVTDQKRSVEAKHKFISVAAHQLETPLSAVKWALQLLINEDFGPLNDSQQKALRDSYKTNERMMQIIDDLIYVARIEDGGFEYDFRENDIVRIISRVMKTYMTIAQDKGLYMTFENNTGRAMRFVFDAEKILLALRNLVDNSIKYTSAGGEVKIILAKRDGEVNITVSDTGIGIPEHEKKHLFSKFFRGADALRTQAPGTGLGLFIVHNIVARHSGRMEVQSEERAGTRVIITLPAKQEHA